VLIFRFQMVREEGTSSLARGVGPNVFRAILMNASQLASCVSLVLIFSLGTHVATTGTTFSRQSYSKRNTLTITFSAILLLVSELYVLALYLSYRDDRMFGDAGHCGNDSMLACRRTKG
jgi:low temperature requirement protein LtrA